MAEYLNCKANRNTWKQKNASKTRQEISYQQTKVKKKKSLTSSTKNKATEAKL